MITYKHSAFVHVIFISVILLLLPISWKVFTDPNFHGTFASKVGFSLFSLMFCTIVLALYLTSGMNRYEITESGLRVRRFLRSTFHPWNEIARISWNKPLHTFFVYGPTRMIFYSSTDCFPNLAQLIKTLHEKSGSSYLQILTKRSQSNNRLT
jgi:hypothetical protein